MANTTEDRVKKIISDHYGYPLEKIDRETHFIDDLGADSLDTVEMVMELEEEFDVSIKEEDSETIKRVGHVIDFIKQERGE